MNRKNKMILMIIGIIIICIVILIVILVDRKKNYNYEFDPVTPEPEIEVQNYIQRVSVRNEFYTIKNIITKFYSLCDSLSSEYNDDNDINEISEDIYDILDEEYINDLKITKNNINSMFNEINTYNFIIDDMYSYQASEDINYYIVYGNVGNVSNEKRENFKYLVKLDTQNKTYSVVPSTEYIDKKGIGDINSNSDISVDFSTESIDKKSSNEYEYSIISDEQYVRDLFNDFKNRALFDRENLYNNLEEEYKKENFDTNEEFKKYCIENVKSIMSMTLSNYTKNKVSNNVVEYTCVDQYENYYKFYEEAPMKYKVKIGK